MPKEKAKAAIEKAKSWINTVPRRNAPEDVPLGGMAGQAKKDLSGRKRRLDDGIARSGG